MTSYSGGDGSTHSARAVSLTSDGVDHRLAASRLRIARTLRKAAGNHRIATSSSITSSSNLNLAHDPYDRATTAAYPHPYQEVEDETRTSCHSVASSARGGGYYLSARTSLALRSEFTPRTHPPVSARTHRRPAPSPASPIPSVPSLPIHPGLCQTWQQENSSRTADGCDASCGGVHGRVWEQRWAEEDTRWGEVEQRGVSSACAAETSLVRDEYRLLDGATTEMESCHEGGDFGAGTLLHNRARREASACGTMALRAGADDDEVRSRSSMHAMRTSESRALPCTQNACEHVYDSPPQPSEMDEESTPRGPIATAAWAHRVLHGRTTAAPLPSSARATRRTLQPSAMYASLGNRVTRHRESSEAHRRVEHGTSTPSRTGETRVSSTSKGTHYNNNNSNNNSVSNNSVDRINHIQIDNNNNNNNSNSSSSSRSHICHAANHHINHRCDSIDRITTTARGSAIHGSSSSRYAAATVSTARRRITPRASLVVRRTGSPSLTPPDADAHEQSTASVHVRVTSNSRTERHRLSTESTATMSDVWGQKSGGLAHASIRDGPHTPPTPTLPHTSVSSDMPEALPEDTSSRTIHMNGPMGNKHDTMKEAEEANNQEEALWWLPASSITASVGRASCASSTRSVHRPGKKDGVHVIHTQVSRGGDGGGDGLAAALPAQARDQTKAQAPHPHMNTSCRMVQKEEGENVNENENRAHVHAERVAPNSVNGGKKSMHTTAKHTTHAMNGVPEEKEQKQH